MRDPKRIPGILKLLEEVWATCPDVRLGQLISNAAVTGSLRVEPDIFYIEDDIVERGLVSFLSSYRALGGVPI